MEIPADPQAPDDAIWASAVLGAFVTASTLHGFTMDLGSILKREHVRISAGLLAEHPAAANRLIDAAVRVGRASRLEHEEILEEIAMGVALSRVTAAGLSEAVDPGRPESVVCASAVAFCEEQFTTAGEMLQTMKLMNFEALQFRLESGCGGLQVALASLERFGMAEDTPLVRLIQGLDDDLERIADSVVEISSRCEALQVPLLELRGED